MQTRAVVSIISALLYLRMGGASFAAQEPVIRPEGSITRWVILGPFPNPETTPEQKSGENRGAFDVDYLKPLGGEAKARIRPDSAVTISDQSTAQAKAVTASGPMLDFCAHYADTDNKLVYAYTEVRSPDDQNALFFLGSDDGAQVWVNGKKVFDILPPTGRGCTARENSFKARLSKGANAILVKVENGRGDWKLALEVYGQARGRQIEADIRRLEDIRAFQAQELTLSRTWPGYVFWNGELPRIVWRDADKVRELQGDVPLKVKWLDGSLRSVAKPDKPGRYGAYIEGKMRNGTPIRRAMTFYLAPPEFAPWWGSWGLPVPYLGKPFDKSAWEERSEIVAQQAGDVYRGSLFTTEQGAWLCAAMAEAKPNGGHATYLDSPEVVNDDFQLALKVKVMGLTDKVRPLAPPRGRAPGPAPVLREASPSEAGVKADAKEKIDSVCRKWAEDSGEPFTVLVARHGVIITHEAFGKTEDGVPVTLDYRNDVASITKAITGMLFSRFLEQGYAKLDDPIGRCLPGFPTTGKHVLTFRHLFTHTSGLTGHYEWGGIHNPHLENVVLNAVDCLQPGASHSYNGMGYDLAGKAMEVMSGKSIVRLMHEGLFNPLGIASVPVGDCAAGARLTSRELGILGQWLAYRGSYGDKQFVSEETFARLLPEQLKRYYPTIDVEWGVGLTRYRELKPGAPAGSKDPKDLIFGENVIGHGSASACVLRVDLDKGLVIVQIRRTAGPKYGEYLPQFLQSIGDSLL